ncbi:Uncharacterized protein SCF082_LOCUS46975, partial [Durusdinium trenchii]
QVSRGLRDTKIESESASVLLPQLKLVGRDKAHAFRKVLQRPYTADGFLNTVMEDFILSKDSMVQRVSNSFDFREWFELEISKQTDTSGYGKSVRNLKAAKHRFESHSTPVARFLLYLPSFVAVVTRIAETKADDAVGKAASLFLQTMTAEQILQLALIADAMDEGLLLVRTVDDEGVDLALISSYVHQFMVRIATLFFENAKVMETGYTKHVIELMNTGGISMFIKRSGEAERLAAPNRETKQRCLDRMQCWAKLAFEVLKTEFPHYGIFNAFGSFQLKSLSAGSSDDGESQAANVERLAQVFK